MTFDPALFAQARTITLTPLGAISIAKSLTIVGLGANTCTVGGNSASRISHQRYALDFGVDTVKRAPREARSGTGSGESTGSGEILNFGVLTLTDVVQIAIAFLVASAAPPAQGPKDTQNACL